MRWNNYFSIFLILFSLLSAGIIIPVLSDENIPELDEILHYYIASEEPGMVIYVTGDGYNATAATGLSDLIKKTPIQENDRFRIGSATKPFVATIILELAEEGRINLDTPLGYYLPDDITARISNINTATIRQVLQMRSGIPDYMTDKFDDAVWEDPAYPWTAAEVVTYSYDIPSEHPAGEAFDYCNNNYVLLQILIEQVTGHSLAEELQTRIFDPTEMNTCFLEDPANISDEITRGYAFEDGRYIDITSQNDGFGLGDGGIIGTAEDIAKFLPALMNNRYLSSNMLEEMLTTLPDDEDNEYGLGISLIQTPFGRLIGHDGASGGFQSSMYYQPETHTSIVFLTNNFDSESMDEILEEIMEIITVKLI